MLNSKGRQRRGRRCCRRCRTGRRCRNHRRQARGDSGSCLSCRQVRRFLDLHPDRSCPNRWAGSRRSTSERCSCEQRGQLSCRHCGACSHRHHALLHRLSVAHSGRGTQPESLRCIPLARPHRLGCPQLSKQLTMRQRGLHMPVQQPGKLRVVSGATECDRRKGLRVSTGQPRPNQRTHTG